MQRRTALVALAAVTACADGRDPVVDPQVSIGSAAEVTLVPGQDTVVAGVRLGFLEVLGDSRCPTDVVCAWAGNGEVMVEVGPANGQRSPSDSVRLNTLLTPRSTDRNINEQPIGVRITLLDLAPERLSTQPLPLPDYRARLRIEPVEP